MTPVKSAANGFLRGGTSLARRIQLQLGLAIAVVIVAGSFLTYWLTLDTLREETLDALQASVVARADYESQPFVTAQDNSVALRDEFLRRLEQAPATGDEAIFDTWFATSPDGLIRVRPQLDDHKHLPSVYIRADVELTTPVMRHVNTAFALLREWGPVLTHNYYSAYIDLPGQSLIMFSPSVNWGKDADVTSNNMDYPPVQNSAPSRNPARRTSWTDIYFDDKAAIWMLSVITPIDHHGEWVGTASQDIAVDELIRRSNNDYMFGTYNFIVNESGGLLAHPDLMGAIQKSSGNLRVASLGDPLLAGFAHEAALLRGRVQVRESPDGEHYLGIARIRGPNWYFVTVYPKALLKAKALAAIEGIALTGAAALLVELMLLAWILRRQVSTPLAQLNRAAASIAQGNLAVSLQVQGKDELSRMGESFLNMAHSLRERDAALNLRAFELENEVIERQASEQRILHMATHDALTGLANRELLQDRLQQALISAQRSGEGVALLFIDLDHFKSINDTLGHDVGDNVLRQVSRSVLQLLRKSDTLCRFGGDEFVLLLPSTVNAHSPVVIAEKILAVLAQPVNLGGVTFTLTCSIGISTFPADGADADALMRNADIAMYRAKEAGRNGYCCYTPQMGEQAGDVLRLEAAIGQALAHHEFVIYFQPKVQARGHRLVAAEALVRWHRPGHGLLSPAAFLPFAQERKLMEGIDHYVLNAVCQHLAHWQAQGLPLVPVAVNLSAGQFARAGLVDEITQLLGQYQLPAHCLQLEITEGVLLHESSDLARNLARLREMGIRISIDDFGTGYSSLSYLHRFPIDELKIDKSFVQNIRADAGEAPLIRAIIGIARDLGLSLVAEGVETLAQAEFLQAQGCDELQGYYFFHPMPDEQFAALLRAQAAGLSLSNDPPKAHL
jgi:diguanylate cyclase (GGDEF)-like protein